VFSGDIARPAIVVVHIARIVPAHEERAGERLARKLGASVTIKEAFRYVKQCQCRTFDWVEPLYAYRRQLGSSGQGYPLKLAINSLYGKLAQRIGEPPWRNPLWAGLITARTRALLMDAAATALGSAREQIDGSGSSADRPGD
jgi:hypothetical protein